jgi:hypothetical protein
MNTTGVFFAIGCQPFSPNIYINGMGNKITEKASRIHIPPPLLINSNHFAGVRQARDGLCKI